MEDLPPEQCWRVAGPWRFWFGDDGDDLTRIKGVDPFKKKPNGALVHLVSEIFFFLRFMIQICCFDFVGHTIA